MFIAARGGSVLSIPSQFAKYPTANTPILSSLGKSGHAPIAQGHADHEQADVVICGISEEIECVRPERDRTRANAGNEPDQEHACVDRKDGS